jgi:hypothetical protein
METPIAEDTKGSETEAQRDKGAPVLQPNAVLPRADDSAGDGRCHKEEENSEGEVSGWTLTKVIVYRFRLQSSLSPEPQTKGGECIVCHEAPCICQSLFGGDCLVITCTADCVVVGRNAGWLDQGGRCEH